MLHHLYWPRLVSASGTNDLFTLTIDLKFGIVIASLYLVLVAVMCAPLVLAQAIHHGNGIAFLDAVIPDLASELGHCCVS